MKCLEMKKKREVVQYESNKNTHRVVYLQS